MKLDDETSAEIQAFTMSMSDKGYHVVGGLISPEGKVVSFCSSPEENPDEHLRSLVKMLYHTVMNGTHTERSMTPLSKN